MMVIPNMNLDFSILKELLPEVPSTQVVKVKNSKTANNTARHKSKKDINLLKSPKFNNKEISRDKKRFMVLQ